MNMGPDGSDLGQVVSHLFLLYKEELKEVVISSACVLVPYFHAASPRGMTCRAFKLTALKNLLHFTLKRLFLILTAWVQSLLTISDTKVPLVCAYLN